MFELYEIIDTTIALLEPHARKKNIKLVSEITNGQSVFADKNMMTTVIRNLASNAIKFTKLSGSVTISSESNDEYVRLKVSDTGVGIPGEGIDKLFRIDESLSTKGTSGELGTGLGLILCKDFVEKNNGTISVESELGKGSVFIVTLPKSS